MTASVSSDNQIFIGIDVGGASFEAAWHRGGCAQYENRPDAIAAFVARLGIEKQIIRIAIEPTGGYEKPLVKALRGAGLPVEMVHTSRFAAYRSLVGPRPSLTHLMPVCWPPMQPPPKRCGAARPITSRSRRMRCVSN